MNHIRKLARVAMSLHSPPRLLESCIVYLVPQVLRSVAFSMNAQRNIRRRPLFDYLIVSTISAYGTHYTARIPGNNRYYPPRACVCVFDIPGILYMYHQVGVCTICSLYISMYHRHHHRASRLLATQRVDINHVAIFCVGSIGWAKSTRVVINIYIKLLFTSI